MDTTELIAWYLDKTVTDADVLYPDNRGDRGEHVRVVVGYLAANLRRNADFELDHLRWMHERDAEVPA